MKTLNEMVKTIKSEAKRESYIKLVFDLLMTFLKDFGLDVLPDYLKQIKNKFTGEYFRTCWYQKHSGIDREMLDYSNILLIDGNLTGKLKLGHMLDLKNSVSCRFEVTTADIGNAEIEDAFEKEWKCLFQNENNKFIDMLVIRLNQNVYQALIKEDPSLKKIFPSYEDFKNDGVEYQYHPSETAIKEAEEILEKLRK